MLYLKLEREEDAFAIVAELLEREADHPQGLRIKAIIEMKKGDFANAAMTLLSVAKVSPSPEIFTSLGEAYLGLQKIPEAMDALHKAMAMSADDPQVIFLLAEAHRKSQQWIKAFYLYRRAASLGAPKDTCQMEARECLQKANLRRRPRAASRSAAAPSRNAARISGHPTEPISSVGCPEIPKFAAGHWIGTVTLQVAKTLLLASSSWAVPV
jgi:tetratricopeptide (TPR) repeat protein